MSAFGYNSIHRSTQTSIEHSLAVFATISHDDDDDYYYYYHARSQYVSSIRIQSDKA